MTMVDLVSLILLLFGAAFFCAGTLGILRLPDIYTRLHALTKAENVGLGLVLAGLALQVESIASAVKLIAIWFLVQTAGASVAHLIARTALKKGIRVWKS